MADTSGVDPNAPQPAGATPEQAAAAIADATAKPADAPAGAQSPTVDWGTVISYGFPSASQLYPSLSIKVGGGTNSGVKYYGFTPRIGDWIMLLRSGRDIWVPGSRPPIGTFKESAVALSDPVLLLCDGSVVPAGYPTLGSLLATLPDLRGVTLMGQGGNGVTAGGRSANGQLPSHAHAHNHGGHSHAHNHGGHVHGGVPSLDGGVGPGGGAGFGATGNFINSGSTTPATDSTSATPATDSTGAGSGSANLPPWYGAFIYVVAI